MRRIGDECKLGREIPKRCLLCRKFKPAHPFLDDEEKMRDFEEMTKEEFLASYSYLTEAEYDVTKRCKEKRNED